MNNGDVSIPLVSCLCVTNNRVAFLERAIHCFLRQTYANKEILIVCLDSDKNTQEYIGKYFSSNPMVKLVCVDDALNYTLGEIRNFSIKSAQGDYICIWDDDDFYHDERIARCVDAIKKSGKEGVVLSNVIIHDAIRDQSYLSITRVWEQTLLFNRCFIQDKTSGYARLNRGEDTALLIQLYNDIYILKDPVLYIYNFHLTNTCDEHHFEAHFKVGERLSSSQEETVSKVLRTGEYPSSCLDAKGFMQDFPLVGKADMHPWGARAFCFYPKLVAG